MQPDCLDDLAYAIMYDISKMSYRVSDADVKRACNQVFHHFFMHNLFTSCKCFEHVFIMLLK